MREKSPKVAKAEIEVKVLLRRSITFVTSVYTLTTWLLSGSTAPAQLQQ